MIVSKKQHHKWCLDTEKINKEFDNIMVGMEVIDLIGNHGIVVKVEEGDSIEGHGTISVCRVSCVKRKGHECEHYSFYGWRRMLRILKG